MFKSKIFYVVLILVLVSAFFVYKKVAKKNNSNEVAYFMKPTDQKLWGVLVLTSGVPDSQNMANGFLCLEQASQLEKVDLYMPDMGHGSEPPKVTQISVPAQFAKYNSSIANLGCYSIESMQIFMPGTWQVRIFNKGKEGAVGIFTLNLLK